MGYKQIDVKATIASRDNLGGGVPFLTIPAGKTTWLRILPPREDHPNDTFFLAMPLHYGVGRNDAIVPCPLRLKQAYCPVCEYNAKLSGLGKEAERVSTRCLMNVVVIDDEGQPVEEKVNVWTAPQQVVIDILEEMAELPEKYQDITDPKKGRDLWIKRRGTTKEKTRYKVGFHDEPSEFPSPELVAQAFDLTAIFPERTEDTIVNLLTGGGSEDPFAELEEGGERPRLPKGRRRVVEEDEDDENTVEGEARVIEEPEEDDPPLPEKESAPKKKGRRVVAEDENEAPAPKARSRRIVPAPEEEPEEAAEEKEEPGSARARLAKHLQSLE